MKKIESSFEQIANFRKTKESLLQKGFIQKISEHIKNKIKSIVASPDKKIEKESPGDISKKTKKDFSEKATVLEKTTNLKKQIFPIKKGAQMGTSSSVGADITGSVIGAGAGVGSAVGLSSILATTGAASTEPAIAIAGFTFGTKATAMGTTLTGLSAFFGNPFVIAGLGLLGGYLGYKYISRLFKK